MKKSLLTLAALSAFAGVAHAQSSVTLFGIIDEGFDAVSNETSLATGNNGRRFGLSSGVMQGSRWGLMGNEDLGNGLNLIFKLESGFDVNAGTSIPGGELFGRQAYFGLQDNDYGTVTFGRQYDPVVDLVAPYAFGSQIGGSYAAHPADIDNFNNSFRVNNAIKYTSPTFDGLTVEAMYGFGNEPGHFTAKQVMSVAGRYEYDISDDNKFSAAVGYLNARDPHMSVFGNDANGHISENNLNSPVNMLYETAKTYQVIGVGGAYTYGPATIGLTYSNVKFSNLAGDPLASYTASGDGQFNNVEVNMSYQLTPELVVGGAYDYTKRSGDVTVTPTIGSAYTVDGGATYHQFSVAADYSLSKRTDVYVQGAFQQASSGDVASIAGLGYSSNNRQAVARVGLRHRF